MQPITNGASFKSYAPAYELKETRPVAEKDSQTRGVQTENRNPEKKIVQSQNKSDVSSDARLQQNAAPPRADQIEEVSRKAPPAPPPSAEEKSASLQVVDKKEIKPRETAVTLSPEAKTETTKNTEDKAVKQKIAEAAYRKAAASNDVEKLKELSEFIPPVPIEDIKPPSAPPGYLPSLSVESLFTPKDPDSPRETAETSPSRPEPPKKERMILVDADKGGGSPEESDDSSPGGISEKIISASKAYEDTREAFAGVPGRSEYKNYGIAL